MKKTTFGMILLMLVFISSCKKDSTANNNTNSSTQSTWTFKSTTMTVDSCIFNANAGALTANTFTNYITINFFNNTLPTTSGTYAVVSNITASNQIAVAIQDAVGYYISTGSGGNQTATLSVSPTGKVTIKANNIQLYYSGLIDTQYVSFNLVQTR